MYISFYMQGLQDNLDTQDEPCEELASHVEDFDEWHDDTNTFEHNKIADKANFKSLDLLPKDELEQRTRSMVPEQRLVLQKVLEFAKTTAAKGTDSLMGAANNIKGIAHELIYVKAENADGDTVFAFMPEDTNNPQFDVLTINTATGEQQWEQ